MTSASEVSQLLTGSLWRDLSVTHLHAKRCSLTKGALGRALFGFARLAACLTLNAKHYAKLQKIIDNLQNILED